MRRLRDIAGFWNWLPAFRAVGETAHLPTAAEAIHLSPSALSRSVQQLEASLGRRLFRRANRRLELTADGAHFLGVLRDAMRMVHEATLAVRGEQLWDPLRVTSGGVATSGWVLPAILELREGRPNLEIVLTTDLVEAEARLWKGELDIAFTSQRLDHRGALRTEKLGVAHAGVYCGPTHPLYHKSRVVLADVVGGEFVAPPPSANGAHEDGWPEDLDRRVVIQIDRMRLGCETCLAVPVLAVLPDAVAVRDGRGELRRLPLELIPAAPVYATLRPPIDHETAAEVLLRMVTARMA